MAALSSQIVCVHFAKRLNDLIMNPLNFKFCKSKDVIHLRKKRERIQVWQQVQGEKGTKSEEVNTSENPLKIPRSSVIPKISTTTLSKSIIQHASYERSEVKQLVQSHTINE